MTITRIAVAIMAIMILPSAPVVAQEQEILTIKVEPSASSSEAPAAGKTEEEWLPVRGPEGYEPPGFADEIERPLPLIPPPEMAGEGDASEEPPRQPQGIETHVLPGSTTVETLDVTRTSTTPTPVGGGVGGRHPWYREYGNQPLSRVRDAVCGRISFYAVFRDSVSLTKLIIELQRAGAEYQGGKVTRQNICAFFSQGENSLRNVRCNDAVMSGALLSHVLDDGTTRFGTSRGCQTGERLLLMRTSDGRWRPVFSLWCGNPIRKALPPLPPPPVQEVKAEPPELSACTSVSQFPGLPTGSRSIAFPDRSLMQETKDCSSAECDAKCRSFLRGFGSVNKLGFDIDSQKVRRAVKQTSMALRGVTHVPSTRTGPIVFCQEGTRNYWTLMPDGTVRSGIVGG